VVALGDTVYVAPVKTGAPPLAWVYQSNWTPVVGEEAVRGADWPWLMVVDAGVTTTVWGEGLTYTVSVTLGALAQPEAEAAT
jgi:hypothetical protein